MEGIRKVLLILVSVLVVSVPVYSQDSKETRGNGNKSEKTESRDKSDSKENKDRAASDRSAAGSTREKETPGRGCGGGEKPPKL